MRSLRVLSVISLFALAACSSRGNDDGVDGDGQNGGSGGGGNGGGPGTMIPGLASLAVTPANATLHIYNNVAATQAYTATGTFDDGHEEDVTTKVSFAVSNGLGSFSANTLTTTLSSGGVGVVSARAGTLTASTSVTVVMHQSYADPNATDLPADPSVPFAGPAAGAASARHPELVYPNDGVLLPPNLGQIEIHFKPGQSNTLFELTFTSSNTDVKVYTTASASCADPEVAGCAYLPNPTVWNWIANGNRGGGVKLTLRATDATGTAVGASSDADAVYPTDIDMTFSSEDIRGGLYYWATPKENKTDNAILRWDFASTTQVTPEKVVDTNDTGGACIGCHALAPNGERMIVSANGSTDANTLLWDIATGESVVPFDSTPRTAFSSYSPDGSQWVGTFGNDAAGSDFSSFDLNVFNAATGEVASTIPVGGVKANPSAHPDWSPKGDRIVFTRIGQRRSDATTAFGAQSYVRMVSRTNGVWGAPVDLTTGAVDVATYYPTFSPEERLIAFNKSTCTTACNDNGWTKCDCDMYDDPTATIYVMNPVAAATPVPLTKANAPGPADAPSTVVQNSFPKWAPFKFQRTGESSSQLYWITVSSNRAYGLRGKPNNGASTLIWMAGVNPDATGAGDPSYPAFLLPFQNIKTDNHTAQWTQKVVETND